MSQFAAHPHIGGVMKKRSFEVPTKVLIAQARAVVRDLKVEGTQDRRAALASVGVDAAVLGQELDAATRTLEELEAEQERAKAGYLREAREDQAIAEEGYRYKLALDARLRAYIARHGDDDDVSGRFRFGHLKSARARGVIYELRVVLPEVDAMQGKLADVGVDAAFVARGHDILARLSADTSETADAKDARQTLTRGVRAAEMQVSRLLAQLVAADEAIALESASEGPVFRLDIIRAEVGRVRAARDSRVAASPVPVSDDD